MAACTQRSSCPLVINYYTLSSDASLGCLCFAVENLFLTRRNVQRACSAVVFDEFISHGKLFTAATKRVISLMHSFTKKISKRKGKDSGEIVLYPVNIDEHCS